MPQAREDAEHLQMPLHAHPLEVAVELAEVVRDRQAGRARCPPIGAILRGP
jgi:hypothetical protein